MPPVRPSTMRVWANSSIRESLRVSARPALPGLPYFIEDQQGCAARDGDVRHVECREIPVVPVKQYEIDDVPMHHSIDRVAQRATQDAGQCAAEQGLARM